MATRRAEAKVATRAKVLDAAKVLFEAGGYEAATIRSIAHVAGMSTGAVFANFASKAEVYRALYGHAPVTPEIGRALYLAAQPAMNESGAFAERLGAVLSLVEEA
jgi:AcrR family transcriptional regulator